MSSSDEDDVRLQQIREAASEELHLAMQSQAFEYWPLTSILDTTSTSSNYFQEKKEPPHCHRDAPPIKASKQDNRKEVNDQSDLKVTPEFRKHVAKKLSAHIDQLLECVEVASNAPKPYSGGGIRLLSESTSLLNDTSSEQSSHKRPRTNKRKLSSSSEEDSDKFASVCVSGESILNGGKGAFKRKLDKTTL